MRKKQNSNKFEKLKYEYLSDLCFSGQGLIMDKGWVYDFWEMNFGGLMIWAGYGGWLRRLLMEARYRVRGVDFGESL